MILIQVSNTKKWRQMKWPTIYHPCRSVDVADDVESEKKYLAKLASNGYQCYNDLLSVRKCGTWINDLEATN